MVDGLVIQGGQGNELPGLYLLNIEKSKISNVFINNTSSMNQNGCLAAEGISDSSL